MKILPISTLTHILCWETNINHQSLLMSDSAMEVVYPKQIFLFIIKVWYMCIYYSHAVDLLKNSKSDISQCLE